MNEHTNTTAEADKPLSFDISEERVTGFLLWAGAISVLLGGVLFVLSDTLSF